jgi:putative two-component system response regulator
MLHSGVVLVIDNEPRSRELVEACLVGQGHELVFVGGPEEALVRAGESVPDAIVLNGRMREIAHTCRQLRGDGTLASTPVLALVDERDRAAEVLGVEAGVDGFCSKPLDLFELRTRLQRLADLGADRRRAVMAGDDEKQLETALDATLESWGRALELRGVEPEGHTERVTDMVVQVAQGMGLSAAQQVHVRRGAMVHDIGKMGIPDRVAFKVGHLDDSEWAVMCMHPAFGRELLSTVEHLGPAVDIPYSHHERWDGTGYPRGLAGDEIPLGARVFAVVDVWDALHSDRSYERVRAQGGVDDYLREQAGAHLDPRVVEAFFDLLS